MAAVALLRGARTVQQVTTNSNAAAAATAPDMFSFRDYAPDPPATPGPPRDLTKGRVKDGTCPEIPFFAPAAATPHGR